MLKNNFDYEQFAEFAKREAEKFLPEGMGSERREFVLDSFSQFALKTGKVLSLDPSLQLDDDKKIVERSKYILEWIFKVNVALAESPIPQECWKGFVLDIGYVAFEISKDLANSEHVSDVQLKTAIEVQIINKIKSLLQNLYDTQIITSDMMEKFWRHPYIDKTVKNIEFSIYGSIN